ncbi:GNAT family N-acetyltransferase [Frondihabitans sp. PhB188]|uniref:GNAT family N-acetyltransferase n=1 Tax=Frondihabitans sp. PhB188 TaxID=2485200 RepID=UPI000F486266|nr:GNAT family N-acetyltransferase [Frondihabitans sp. PhB188]
MPAPADPTPDAPRPDAFAVVWTTADAPLARPLVDDLARDYDARYEPNDGIPSSAELTRYPVELFTPERGGAFLILTETAPADPALDAPAPIATAVAGGAFIRVDGDTVEMKRVWTHPDHRRRGLARRVMAVLEAEALARGYTTAQLTTGARQPEALGLYLRLGYEPLFDLDGDYEQISYLRFRKVLASPGA